MTIRITTCARSPLGQWLALAGVCIPLILIGLYLATDGAVVLKFQNLVSSLTTSKNIQQSAKDFLTALGLHFRKYDRVELLVYYGVAILLAFISQGVLARVIRSYRYAFIPGKKVLERQAVWLFIPAWAAVWIGLAVVLYLIVGTRVMVFWWLPLWVLLAVVIPLVTLVPAWIYVPKLVRRDWFIPGLKRQVALARIKRMEVQAGAEGGAALVVTFCDDWTWTIAQGSPKRLERIGGALGRVIGLARRDLVTWS